MRATLYNHLYALTDALHCSVGAGTTAFQESESDPADFLTSSEGRLGGGVENIPFTIFGCSPNTFEPFETFQNRSVAEATQTQFRCVAIRLLSTHLRTLLTDNSGRIGAGDRALGGSRRSGGGGQASRDSPSSCCLDLSACVDSAGSTVLTQC